MSICCKHLPTYCGNIRMITYPPSGYGCVLLLLWVCPLTVMCVSSYYYGCVLLLLCVCPLTVMYVSFYCYVCVLLLLWVRPLPVMCVSSYCNVCILLLLCVCSLTVMGASSYCYVCVLLLLCVCPSGGSRISKREVPTQIHSQALPDSCPAFFCNARYNYIAIYI